MSAEKDQETPSETQEVTDGDGTHEPSGYRKSAHGINYQLKMLMFVLNRTYRTYPKFKLATEMKDAGDFDDIVLEYEDKDGRIATVLIQCKHKADETKKITLNDLLEEGGQFCVQRYLNSYTNIKKNNFFTKKSIKSVLWCTHIDIDEQLKADERIVEETRKDNIVHILQFRGFKKENNEVPTFYKIKNAEKFEVIKKKGKKGGERIKTKLNRNDIEEFEEKFLIAVNLPNENDLDDIIKKEMGEEFYVFDSRAIVGRLYNYIHQWMSHSEGNFIGPMKSKQFFSDLKEEIRKMETEGVIFRNREKRLEFGDFFKTTTDLENKLKPTLTHSLVHVKSKSPSLTIIKIVQLLKDRDNYVALSLETLLTLAERVKDTFESKLNFTVYVECAKIKENDLNRAKVVLEELLQKAVTSNGKKSIVLVSHEKNYLIEFFEKLIPTCKLTTIEDRNIYQDFTQSTKERILDYNVNFQGCDIKLREIVNDEFEDILDEEVLNKIIEKDQIMIGKPVEMTEELRRSYIRRNLQINLERLKKKHENKSEEEIKEIAKAQSENQICIIEGGPGIGKSTVLTKMAIEEKNENKSEFVLNLNLLDYSSEFAKVNEFGKETLIHFLIKIQKLDTEFEINTLKHQLFRSCGMIVLLDGFDEISPDYEKAVISLIKVLINEMKVRKVWVTTRPHATNPLEKQFEPAVYQLRPFDEKDRKEFLKNYWNNLLKVTYDTENIRTFADKLLDGIRDSGIEEVKQLIGVPLQMRMIAEVFADECKEYSESKGQIKVELKNINVYELFKEFIDRKFEIYFRERAQMDRENPRMKTLVKNELKRYKKKLQKMAFRLIFPDDCAAFVKSSKEEIDTELLSVGIIEKRNDSCVFIHRTFAEYFTAEFLAEKLIHDNKNEELIQFLHDIYFQRGNYMIRYCFDCILAEDSEIHMATINNDLNKVKELIDESRSLLLKKDLMGRIPLHLSCVYSTFPGKTLYFPVNNVLDFLICKDIETNNPMQILAQDILNYTPFVYAEISRNKDLVLDLLNWNYYEYHFQNNLDLNKIALQFRNIGGTYTSEIFPAFKIEYKVERNNIDYISHNDNFKAIKPYFYQLEDKTQKCKMNDHKILKPALKSYFIDVVCLNLTDRSYLEEMDGELCSLQLYHEWFTEAINTKDYAFLLGITLACPQTAFKLWMLENNLKILKESFNERDDRLQIFNKIRKVLEKPKFFSDNKLKNYLVLAVRKLLKSRAVKTPRQMNCNEYFRRVFMDDYISFEISLKLVDEEDREKILRTVDDFEDNIILAITQTNPCKLNSTLKYLRDYFKCMNQEKIAKIHWYMNADVDSTIRYMKNCMKNYDIAGISVLLSHTIRYFCAETRYRIMKSALRQSSLFEDMKYFHMWDNYSDPNTTFFFNSSAMNGNIFKKIDETLDQYGHAKYRGYPLSITQHIISHIVWLNSSGIPAFIEKHFQGSFAQYKFMESLIQDVKCGNINDLLRYFTFANDKQRKAVLTANKSEIVKYLIKAKRECSDDERRAANKVNNPKPFMSEEYSSEVIKTPEYEICLLYAFERSDLRLLHLLNIFFKHNTEIIFWKNMNFSIILEIALSQMNYKWIMKLLELPRVLHEIERLKLSNEWKIRFEKIYEDNISDVNEISFGYNEKNIWNQTMLEEALEKAVIEKDYNRVDNIFRATKYRREWIKNMTEKVALRDYINYFQFFGEKRRCSSIVALLQFTDNEERSAVYNYVSFYDTQHVYSYTQYFYLANFTKFEWQQLNKYLFRYQSRITNGLHCSIFKYVFYCIACISVSIDLPKCISCYITAGDDLNSINHAQECIKLKRTGDFEELCEWFYNSSLEEKKEILRTNNYEILKHALRKDYLEKLIIYFDEDGKKSLRNYTDIISEKEIFALDEYLKCVSAALKMKSFNKLRCLTDFLGFENNLQLCQKVDYENAFKDALKHDNYKGVGQLLRVFHSKCDELCALPEFVTYLNKALEYNTSYKFSEITDILSQAQKSKVLKSLNYVNNFKAALLSRDSHGLMQLLKVYKNENICFEEVFLKVKFGNFLKYCKHFIDKRKVTSITREGGERLKSLLDLDWSDASKNTPDTSQIHVKELTISVKFLDKFPSAARGYPWSIFFYAFCMAICHIKSKPIPRCISIYFEEENGENPVNYIGEIRKVIEAGHVNESLIWFFMATDEQQKEIFKDDFMKGYFAEILKNNDFALMVYFSQEMEAEILSLSAFTDRIAYAIKNEEFQYLANVTQWLSKKTQASLWKQTDYFKIHRDAVKNRDRKMKVLIYSLFYEDEKFKKYS